MCMVMVWDAVNSTKYKATFHDFFSLHSSPHPPQPPSSLFSFLVTTSSFTDTDFHFPGVCQTFRQERIWIEWLRRKGDTVQRLLQEVSFVAVIRRYRINFYSKIIGRSVKASFVIQSKTLPNNYIESLKLMES